MPQPPLDFDTWYLNAKVPQIRYTALVTTLLYFIYTALEYHLALNYSAERFLLHGILVPVSMGLVGIFTHFPRYHKLMTVMLMLAPIVANTVNVYLNIGSANFSYFAPELYLSIMWTFAISGLNLRGAMISATGSVAIVLLVSIKAQLPTEFLWLHFMWLFSAYSFGFVSALVLERVHYSLYEKHQMLATLASRDPLTQLWNRDKMTMLFNEEKRQAIIQQQRMAIIMLDIDHFKAVNDTHGHEIGDKVLQHFAHILRNNVRPQDHVGRHGGEEFVVIMPHTSADEAQSVAQRLQQQINLHEFPHVGHKTASLGITQAISPTEPLTTMLRRADTALYQAKAQGRNTIVFMAADAELQSLKQALSM